MINYNFITTNRVKILITVLVLSLFGNFYLMVKLSNYENRTAQIRGNEYSSYFGALKYYGNSMDYLVSNEVKQSDATERELQALYGHSFNLVEHARAYSHLSDNKENELANLIWNLAVHVNDVTANLNKAEIKSIVNLKDFSRIINEIVKLENETRLEMFQNNKRFVEKEMYTVLCPKVEKAKDIDLFTE